MGVRVLSLLSQIVQVASNSGLYCSNISEFNQSDSRKCWWDTNSVFEHSEVSISISRHSHGNFLVPHFDFSNVRRNANRAASSPPSLFRKSNRSSTLCG